MSPIVLSNIANVLGGVEDTSSRAIMLSILKILDIKCEDDTLTYTGGGVSYSSKITYRENIHFKVTPLTIDSYDLQDMLDILNQKGCNRDIYDLFLSLGYIVNKKGDILNIEQSEQFKKNNWQRLNFDWKEEGGWKEDTDTDPLIKELNGSIYDWKRGKGWVDGIDMENAEIKWKKELNQQDNELI